MHLSEPVTRVGWIYFQIFVNLNPCKAKKIKFHRSPKPTLVQVAKDDNGKKLRMKPDAQGTDPIVGHLASRLAGFRIFG